jgi:pyrimidine deaminase RibD-like protein
LRAVSIQPAGPPGLLARRALLFTPGPRLGWVYRDQPAHLEPFPQPPPDEEAMRQAASDHADAATARYARARRYAGTPAVIAAAAVLAAAVLQAAIHLHGTLSGHKITVTGGWLALAACVVAIAVTVAVRRHALRANPRHADAAWAAYLRVRSHLGVPALIALAAILVAGAATAGMHGSGAWVAIVLAVLLAAGGIGGTIAARSQAAKAAHPARLADGGYQQALADWQQQARAWDQSHAAQVWPGGPGAQGWVSTGAGSGRADVFGGSLAGWQALLTTHGASLLADRPLLVVDLTGEVACAELAQTAAAAGVPAASWLLPSQLAETGILATLTPAQLAGALAEAIHASGPGGETGMGRADRALDTRVLEQLAEALGEQVTPARLAAATRAALGHAAPGANTPLTQAEQGHIATALFPGGYRRQIEPALARIEAFLTDLARHADPPGQQGQPGGPAAYLTCLALEPAARTARTEALAALIVQWLTVQVTASRDPAPAVVVAGADDITRAHLERLADACERRRVPLTLMFRHLRDAGLAMLGGGTAGFMRLGNHAEAEQAANFIGRQHTFVLSQLTAGHGGSRTSTDTRSQADTRGDTITVGWNTGWNNTSTGLLLGEGSHGRSGGKNRATSRSVSRTWSDAQSWADGVSWNNTDTRQRVYEYTVEPTVLQHLPDQALLLVTSGRNGPVLHAIECDPAIITLPGAAAPPGGHGQPPVAASGMPGGHLGTTPAGPGITSGGQRPTWPQTTWQRPDWQPDPRSGPPPRWPPPGQRPTWPPSGPRS